MFEKQFSFKQFKQTSESTLVQGLLFYSYKRSKKLLRQLYYSDKQKTLNQEDDF